MQTAPTPLRLAPHPSPCGAPLDGGVESFHVVLPRRSVSPRGVVRPAEVWRMAQEIAVQAACKLGWPPERFRSQRTAFIVAEMTVRHLRELAYGERVVGSTWVQDLKRGTISHRQLQLDATQGPFAVATQRWVHVYQADDGSIHVGRASDDLLEAFAPHPRPEPLVELPALPRALHPDARAGAGAGRADSVGGFSASSAASISAAPPRKPRPPLDRLPADTPAAHLEFTSYFRHAAAAAATAAGQHPARPGPAAFAPAAAMAAPPFVVPPPCLYGRINPIQVCRH
jgi:acyl-CoA thioesterase FadM